jgi:hypothetical protein
MAEQQNTRSRFIETARRQLQTGWIPMIVAVIAAVAIARLGAPMLLLGGLGLAGAAYVKGYRVRLQIRRPEKPRTSEPTPQDFEHPQGD